MTHEREQDLAALLAKHTEASWISALAEAYDTATVRAPGRYAKADAAAKAFAADNAILAERIAELEQWTHEHGKALVPHGGWHDSFGDGMRAAKQQVSAILARRAAKKGTAL